MKVQTLSSKIIGRRDSASAAILVVALTWRGEDEDMTAVEAEQFDDFVCGPVT